MIVIILYIFLLFNYSDFCRATTIKTLQDFKECIVHEYEPVCAFIFADWCYICRQIEPVFDTITNNTDLNSKISFLRVSFDHIPELQTEFGITKVPTICFFSKEGILMEQIEGVKNINEAQNFYEKKINNFIERLELRHEINSSFKTIKKYVPTMQEAKNWFFLICKENLIRLRDGLDKIIYYYF